MKTVLLQAPESFSNINPSTVYGLFVVALIGAIVYFARRLDKKETEYSASIEKKDLENKAFAEKCLVALTLMNEKVLDLNETKEDIKAMSSMIKESNDILNRMNNGKS